MAVRNQSSISSINLGSIRGIPIRIHFTFFLFLLFVIFDHPTSTNGVIAEVITFLSIFFCILLHELGHALTGQYFGIKTRDIVLYPFGGVASITSPLTPWSELVVALAGPVVNVVIAIFLYPFVSLEGASNLDLFGSGIITSIFVANIVLVVFNMIPALPMDGGRVLRSLLALAGVRGATRIAARVSQAISVAMGIFALFNGMPILLFISLLVFFGASQEYMHETAKSASAGKLVRDVMTEASHLVKFPHGTTIEQALDSALRSFQESFPVLHESNVIGLLPKDALIQARAMGEENDYVGSLMIREFPVASPEENLDDALEKLEEQRGLPLVVISEGRFVGMVYREKVLEYLLVNRFRDSNQSDE